MEVRREAMQGCVCVWFGLEAPLNPLTELTCSQDTGCSWSKALSSNSK